VCPVSAETSPGAPTPQEAWLGRGGVKKNYRPVSNLSFLSKHLERVVAKRLTDHMAANNIWEPFQSAYRCQHSTETALIKVHNDIMRALDDGKVGVLVMLDLSAAFDTVDHEQLLARLHAVGVRGKALSWFRSYLKDRAQLVVIEGCHSSEVALDCGVPQGSVLGPLLFSLYIGPLGALIRNHGLDFHFYADDSQLYVFSEPVQGLVDGAVARIERCVHELRTWLRAHFLRCNSDKTEVLVVGSRCRVAKIKVPHVMVGDSAVHPVDSVRDLGAVFDTEMTMEAHVTAVCRSARFHLRNIGKVRRYLTSDTCQRVIHALVSCRLDINNALLVGLPQRLISKIQRCQNVAARIVACQRQSCHITPVLMELHWLPVVYRIQYKVLLHVYRALNGLSPEYLASALERYVPSRQLRSTDCLLLKVPHTKHRWGDRAFSKVGPVLWNGLPLTVRGAPSLDSFKRQLKTILFTRAFADCCS